MTLYVYQTCYTVYEVTGRLPLGVSIEPLDVREQQPIPPLQQ